MIQQETLRHALAANLRRMRKSKGLTQEELAEKLGISATFINRLEQEKSSPSAETLYSIADYFGVTADALRQISDSPID